MCVYSSVYSLIDLQLYCDTHPLVKSIPWFSLFRYWLECFGLWSRSGAFRLSIVSTGSPEPRLGPSLPSRWPRARQSTSASPCTWGSRTRSVGLIFWVKCVALILNNNDPRILRAVVTQWISLRLHTSSPVALGSNPKHTTMFFYKLIETYTCQITKNDRIEKSQFIMIIIKNIKSYLYNFSISGFHRGTSLRFQASGRSAPQDFRHHQNVWHQTPEVSLDIRHALTEICFTFLGIEPGVDLV